MSQADPGQQEGQVDGQDDVVVTSADDTRGQTPGVDAVRDRHRQAAQRCQRGRQARALATADDTSRAAAARVLPGAAAARGGIQ